MVLVPKEHDLVQLLVVRALSALFPFAVQALYVVRYQYPKTLIPFPVFVCDE